MTDQPKSRKRRSKLALATPRINIVPVTPKNLSPRGSIQAAIRLGASRHRTAV
jgi:hypothetical protein